MFQVSNFTVFIKYSFLSFIDDILGPTEDYSKDVKKEKNKEGELNAKQKALAKSAEGTKNIMSFFKKK